MENKTLDRLNINDEIFVYNCYNNEIHTAKVVGISVDEYWHLSFICESFHGYTQKPRMISHPNLDSIKSYGEVYKHTGCKFEMKILTTGKIDIITIRDAKYSTIMVISTNIELIRKLRSDNTQLTVKQYISDIESTVNKLVKISRNISDLSDVEEKLEKCLRKIKQRKDGYTAKSDF